MRPIREAAVAIFIIMFVGQHIGADRVDFHNPVRSAAEDELESLPGLEEPLRSKLYAGYLNAHKDGANEQWLYYWFIESSSQPSSDPIILWLSGELAGSSMKGVFDVGPFKWTDSGFSIDDQSSWNGKANLLFIESPVGAGFSYSKDPSAYESNDEMTADANYLALKSFVDKFPQYAKNPLYLAGVSYAGAYLPTLGVLLDRDPKFNLRGVAIKNGILDEFLQKSSAILYAYYDGLITEKEWINMGQYCCQGYPPTRKSCITTRSRSEPVCRRFIFDTYARLTNEWSKESAIQKGMLLHSETSSRPDQKTNGQFHSSRCYKFRVLDPNQGDLTLMEAIHVPLGIAHGFEHIYCYQRALAQTGVAPEMKTLIESKRNLTMLVYNSDTDFAFNYIGSWWFVENLGQEALSKFEIWKHQGKVAGYLQQFQGIAYATVHASDGSVEGGKRGAELALMENFLILGGREEVTM